MPITAGRLFVIIMPEDTMEKNHNVHANRLILEPAANRTQADAFHASFQAFLENVLVPDCLLGSHY